MKYFLVLLILALNVFAEDELSKEDEDESVEAAAAQFMDVSNPVGHYWGINQMTGRNPVSGLMSPMNMMDSLDASDESHETVGVSSGFMVNPMIGGCASVCNCRQQCAMMWWMPCACGPCNGCGCCNGGNGGGATTTTETTTQATVPDETTNPSCDRNCCNGCSCGKPCTIWWMCPKPCAPSCCKSGCCNSNPTPAPPPSCCSCPTCVPWFPCQPCKCLNNCCPGSSCCSGSGCDKPEPKPTNPPLPPIDEGNDKNMPGDKWEERPDWKIDDRWEIPENPRWDERFDPRRDGPQDRWNDRSDARIQDRWDAPQDRWNEREDPRVQDRLNDLLDRAIQERRDSMIRERWDDFPSKRDPILDMDKIRDRREPAYPPSSRDSGLQDWEIRELLERLDRRDPRDDFPRNTRT